MCFYSSGLFLAFWILSSLLNSSLPVFAGNAGSWYRLTSSSHHEASQPAACIFPALKFYAPALIFSGRRYLQGLNARPPPTSSRCNPVLVYHLRTSVFPTHFSGTLILHSPDGSCARFFLLFGTDHCSSLGKLHNRNFSLVFFASVPFDIQPVYLVVIQQYTGNF